MKRWYENVENKTWPLHYIVNVLHGVDACLNAILLGNRFETISGRLGKGIVRGSRVCILLSLPIELLFWILCVDPFGDHCISTAYFELYEHNSENSKLDRSYAQFKRGLTDE